MNPLKHGKLVRFLSNTIYYVDVQSPGFLYERRELIVYSTK